MNATIFNIQKFCVNDGPGIRTTVFFKGCPLNCIWCHNPESKSVKKEILFDAKKCVGCKACAMHCKNGCHTFTNDAHLFDRSQCIGCHACTEVCYPKALEVCGREESVEDILKTVMKDKLFYEKSGGGLTVSGGEPMAQFDVVFTLLQKAKELGLHTAMETCGFAQSAHFRTVAPYVDLFLFDYKVTDPTDHKKYVGVEPDLILQNLALLDELGADIILRCPIIPGCNDDQAHLLAIAALAQRYTHILEIQIEPYHPLGSGKSAMLGKEYALEGLSFPEKEAVAGWISTIQEHTTVPVKRA